MPDACRNSSRSYQRHWMKKTAVAIRMRRSVGVVWDLADIWSGLRRYEIGPQVGGSVGSVLTLTATTCTLACREMMEYSWGLFRRETSVENMIE